MLDKPEPSTDAGQPNNRASDEAAGFDLTDAFEEFNQKNDVFRRSWWDDRIRSDKARRFYDTYRKPLKTWRKADGFTQKDYALRNAAWHVSDLFTEMKEDEDRREGFTDTTKITRNGGFARAAGWPARRCAA